jgi:DNA-binding beta-propeller fold protein YncE
MRRLCLFATLPLLLLAACGGNNNSSTGTGGTGGSTTGTAGSGGSTLDPDEFLQAPKSCSYTCPDPMGCPEKAGTPYACPAMGKWDALPHLDTCAKYDGTTPAVTPGKCTATAPAAAALRRPGQDAQDPKTYFLPDGRSTRPAGATWAFDEQDITGGTTSAIVAVPGTPYVLALDTGPDDHAVRAIDTTKIDGGASPVTGVVKFSPPKWLNSGIAFVPPGRVYAATAFGVVQALAFDPKTGALSQDDANSLTLPTDPQHTWYASGVAASPDGKRLVVSAVNETDVVVFDIDPASPTYKQQIGSVDTGQRDTFGAYFDPADAAGTRAYVTVWGGRKVLEIALDDPKQPKVSRTFATDQNPQGVAFLDAQWMAVANDLGETISLVDRVSGEVKSVTVEFAPALHGLDVSGLAFDAKASRLYALLSSLNAIAAYDVDLKAKPPALTPAGRLPTGWWPSGAVVEPDGSLDVINLRGRPIGTFDQADHFGGPDSPSGHHLLRGSIQRIPAPSAADLTAGTKDVDTALTVGDSPGYPQVQCPAGADDFPVPATNTMGPSKAIQRIVFIVRENKTFDSVLGDLKGVEGNPAFTLKETSADMDKVWPNFRTLARTFTVSDNFYNVAVQSTQGHQWTTYGRTTDFCERTWSADARPVPLCGVGEVGRPDQGSLFDWLQDNKVQYDILGEIVGTPKQMPADYSPIDGKYPGGPFQNITYPDVEKACHFAGRTRVACDLHPFTYMTLPNDHTVGLDPKNPTPETMCAVNDEATGMVIDALSHSPDWPGTLVVITEDDPQQGGDHVDYHRTPLVFISPWVKRGYVTQTHLDVASLYKLFAHLMGLPYPSVQVARAGLPLDAFTSTPDYTPYDYQTHKWQLACGGAASHAERRLTASWDFSVADAQDGLGDQVARWMRGKQLETLPPALEAQVKAREERKAMGLPPEVEADDDD